MNLLRKFTQTFLSAQKRTFEVILFDSISSAEDLAFMLGGEWDGCNSITWDKYDSVAVAEAAALTGAKWCRLGQTMAYLPKLKIEDLIRRYQTGDRNFINANLRSSCLSKQYLQDINLSYALLDLADLNQTDLRLADLSSANVCDANLTQANLTDANLFRTNLSDANLIGANLTGANLHKACLKRANLTDVNLTNANLTQADLRGAVLDNVLLSGADLTNTLLTVEQLSDCVR
jgi:uncharacterized protein YjbI with pentapeptide repeats